MPHPLVLSLEEAFQEVRDKDWTLGERLNFIADTVRTKGPGFMAEVERFVARLEAARAGASAPQVGERMPGFTMPDQDGRLVSLDALLADGPVVLAFYRGHWCPYCRLNIVGLAEIQDQVAPCRIVGISAEVQRFTRETRAESGARFPLLTDVAAGYALSLNLAIIVDDRMSSMIGGAGWDVPLYQGGSDWVLPIPAVFVLDPEGTIVARHVDPDYRRRMELEDLLGSLDRFRDAAAPVGRAQQVEERARLA
ncbi:peroxiredoxin-like family protein [Sphingomonas arenae]|uniref:peroxiredoxin-like family protein n=1 Tax=Sphingomonas arenae TaxID=2812555 RepID=UPI00196778AC|nr:peroxiredoxin-like family protein [Sphingomonas arenae]